MKLILIRHGETEWNSARRIQGRTDIPLNARGMAQAAAIAKRLAASGISAVYTSPLRRSYDTAKAIADASGARLITADDLVEIRFGSLEGLTYEEIMQRIPEHWANWSWALDPACCKELGAETSFEVYERASKRAAQIISEHGSDETVAIVSHSMPVKMIFCAYTGFPIEKTRNIATSNCSYTELEIRDGQNGTLRAWNDVSHLAAEGLE